jgi:hypothetical protein
MTSTTVDRHRLLQLDATDSLYGRPSDLYFPSTIDDVEQLMLRPLMEADTSPALAAST